MANDRSKPPHPRVRRAVECSAALTHTDGFVRNRNGEKWTEEKDDAVPRSATFRVCKPIHRSDEGIFPGSHR
jgi:hypothetical protein